MNTNFRRQFLPMAGLILAAIIFLGVVFHAFLYNYIISNNEDTLRNNATAVSDLASAYRSTSSLERNMAFCMDLSFAATLSDVQTLICSETGEVLLCSEDIQGCAHVGQSIDSEYVEKAFENGSVSSTSMVSGLYDQTRLAVAVPIVSSDGENVGLVVSSMRMTSINAVLHRTTRIFILTAAAVLLAALLIMSELTRRQDKPLKEMAAAARQLGLGNLDVRVSTGYTREFDELAVAFNNMATSLQKSETQRQEFVANISHELKTPMTTIAGYMDGMLDGTIPKEKHAQYMQVISSEVRRLSRLVRSMLEISRMQSQGADESRRCKFDLCETAGQVLLSFEQKINRKKLDVQVQMPDVPLYAFADPDAITQVIYNLTDNAVKFCDESGTLGLRVYPQDGKIVTAVSNTGTTIPPDELPLIFDRFHKTDKSRSMDRDGVGLGLYIVKTIICSHGEDITVTSRDGKTEFSFTLPAAK
jgi:signal transduction histidine kinase